MKRRQVLTLAFVATGLGMESNSAMSAGDELDVKVSAPRSALSLFDGKDLSAWLSRKGGGPASWKVKDGYMEVVPLSGDIYTRENFRDFQLHVEFWLPYMPEAKGQARANSGVYLQGRYEVQVLDSYGLESRWDDCGAIYKFAAPLRNACKKPETWQTYDIAFRACRFDDNGRLKEQGRVTMFHNGFMIHNNLQLNGPSGGAFENDESKTGPILLQDHQNLVRYRNIWIIPA